MVGISEAVELKKVVYRTEDMHRIRSRCVLGTRVAIKVRKPDADSWDMTDQIEVFTIAGIYTNHVLLVNEKGTRMSLQYVELVQRMANEAETIKFVGGKRR